MKRFFFISTFAYLPFCLFSQQIWHVKYDASGTNTGLNWQDAFTDLQSALQFAQYGDDIWVAAGTYKPTQGSDRTVTFDLPKGVRLAGGFAGNETLFGQRDWATQLTILSGDIGIAQLSEDNSHHVVRIYGGDTQTVLDGVKIMHGRSGTFNEPDPLTYGGGLLVWADELRPVSIPLVKNCTFEQNYAVSGGGMACVSQYQEYISSPTVLNCTFHMNRGEIGGGSFRKTGKGMPDQPFTIRDCTFTKNYCTQLGGAMSITESVGDVHLLHCVFLSDTCNFESGALYLESNEKVQYLIDSCTFSFNYARNGSGGAISYVQNSDTILFQIRNSHFLSNRVRFNNGGAVSIGALGEQATVSIKATRFENNISQAGGSLYIEGGGASDTRISIDRCFFLKNKYSNLSPAAGGAFFFRSFNAFFAQNYTRITNSVFAFNDGAFVSLGLEPSILETDIVNCTFLNNGLVPFLKYWTPEFNDTNYYQKMSILNSLIWEEESPGPYRLFYNNDSDNFNVNDYVVDHCLLNLPTCEYEGIDPCGAGMIYETSPQFVSTAPVALDLSTGPGSPVIHRGSNMIVDTFGLQYDFAGLSRIFQDTVDIGAFESDSITSNTLEPAFEQESFLLQVLPNTVYAGQPILASILNLYRNQTFILRLSGADGREYYRSILKQIPSQMPVYHTIQTDHLPSGIYFISVSDSFGKQKTQRIILK